MTTGIEIPKPEDLSSLSKTQLVDLHENSKHIIDELSAMQTEIRNLLHERVDNDGEVISGMQVTKAERTTINTTVEQAEEFGAVTEEVDGTKISLDTAKDLGLGYAIVKKVDVAMVRKMIKKGAVVPGIEKTGYIIIKAVKLLNNLLY